MTRRDWIAAAGAGGLLASKAAAQSAAEAQGGPAAGAAPQHRTAPMLCVYSQNMVKVPYAELGTIAQQLGYDGVDLSVMQGGHVDPHIANVDLVRAFESVRGAGLEVPVMTTRITSFSDPTAYPVLAIAGRAEVPLYRTGIWKYGETPNIPQRLAEVKRDLTALVALGRRYGIAAAIPNRAGGNVGQATWDTQTMIGDMDPQWVGYFFDPAQATAEGGLDGWAVALRLAMPRLKAVSLGDFVWTKQDGRMQMQMCPLGEGIVDWNRFFDMLAAARFTGPVSVSLEYKPANEIDAMKKDGEFVRKQIQRAYASAASKS